MPPSAKGPLVRLRALNSTGNVCIPLVHIETICFKPTYDEDKEVVNKLKDSHYIYIVTHSGESYTVDVKDVCKEIPDVDQVELMLEIIYESWMYHINN